MAVELATGYVSLVPSGRGLGKAIGEEMSGSLVGAAGDAGDESAKGFFARFSDRGKGLATTAAKGLAVGLAAGIGAAVVLGSGALDAAEEAQKIAKQTEAVIKSTGGAAGLSAQQFSDLAGEISALTGVDDEAIQSAENLLATFTNVKDGVGEGNDIFSDATRTLVDMGAALGTDASSSAIQLGKALNDPIKGISALSRVGVTFTDQQKEQIRVMQEAGDMAGAQRVILNELAKEFGGSAAAQATASDKMRVAVGNLQEQFGAFLIPIVSKFATFVTTTLVPAIERGVAAFQKNWPAIKEAVMPTLEAILGALQAVAAWVVEHWPQISATITEVMNVVGEVIGAAVAVITVLWQNFGDNILRFVHAAWDPISSIIEGVMMQIRGIVDVIGGLLTGDWQRVWDGLQQIVVGVWKEITGKIQLALAALQLIISVPLELIQAGWERVWGAIRDFVGDVWDAITGSVTSGVDNMKAVVEGGINAVVGFVTGLPGRVAGIIDGMWDGIVDGFKTAINTVIRLFNSFKVPEMTVGGQDPLGSFGPSIPEVTIGGWSFKNIPYLADGALAYGPALAVVGDNPGARHDPEVIAPLSKLQGMGGSDASVVTELRAIRAALGLPRVIREGSMTTDQFLVEQRRRELLMAGTWTG